MSLPARITVDIDLDIDPEDWGCGPSVSDTDLAAQVADILDGQPEQIVFFVSDYPSSIVVRIADVEARRGA